MKKSKIQETLDSLSEYKGSTPYTLFPRLAPMPENFKDPICELIKDYLRKHRIQPTELHLTDLEEAQLADIDGVRKMAGKKLANQAQEEWDNFRNIRETFAQFLGLRVIWDAEYLHVE